MTIYKRDYYKLTSDELAVWEKLKREEIVQTVGDLVIRKPMFREYPKAVRHYQSLFPNNYLDIVDLKQNNELPNLLDKYSSLLNDETINERTILNFIKENEAYFIIASIFTHYSFGHHDAFIFPEFQFGTMYQIDYVLVGRSSGGYQFIFVELEHPYKNIFMANGHLGDGFRKGTNQVKDWKIWLDENFHSLSETFEKYKNKSKDLPREFLKRDNTRYHYVVVAGRRNNFQTHNEKAYRLARELLSERVQLLHYDNLYDLAKAKIGEDTY